MEYTITVVRDGSGGINGRLIFGHGTTTVNTPCWWDPLVRVDSGTYVGCATRMANKGDGRNGRKREAIWLGKAVPVNQREREATGIFIHKGTGPGWSDGCVVCAKDEVERIWDVIEPKESFVVEVHVYNTYDVDRYRPLAEIADPALQAGLRSAGFTE